MFKGKMLASGIILLFSITLISAAQIEGLWQVNRSNDLVEIRSTNDGVKARFVNSNNWDRYERIRRDIYEDRRGNRYYLKSNSRLTWESRDGRRIINLEKASTNSRRSRGYEDYGSSRRNRAYDDYGSNQHGNHRGHARCTSYCGAGCTFSGHVGPTFDDGLSGTWTNRWRNTIAYVQYDGYNLRMKTNRSRRWTTYRRTNNRRLVFEDKFGNRLRLRNNGRLEWRRSDGRRNIDFVRQLF